MFSVLRVASLLCWYGIGPVSNRLAAQGFLSIILKTLQSD